ncbi:hypothetical protein GCM10023201_00710 [Actinomycetospora corticicola]|uniref:ABC-type Zn2+ transport system substrate-binding protein/surface adhesin n=1 Tax=Actinomycetospora corticicola TaxID=663602 RepID=A0A7Y9E160_9PSEU|nr:hypothetical protein [Actinomycetospora corticicola]NYD39334.1 ABC-type Zn2+ transport system substrate-binding protein/surface adhesin [Actinomycetospora corticicola]
MLLKKAGMIVLGTAAGVAALSGTAFAGDMPSSTGHDHSWDRGHDHGHHHGDRDRDNDRGNIRFSDDDFSPSASNEQGFFGDQTGLVNLGNTNVQAPISAAIGLLGAVNG